METNPHAEQTDQAKIAIELKKLVLDALKGRLRSLTIDVSEQGIVLRGECQSFHAKQMVQEIVKRNSPMRILSNDLVVDDRKT